MRNAERDALEVDRSQLLGRHAIERASFVEETFYVMRAGYCYNAKDKRNLVGAYSMGVEIEC